VRHLISYRSAAPASSRTHMPRVARPHLPPAMLAAQMDLNCRSCASGRDPTNASGTTRASRTPTSGESAAFVRSEPGSGEVRVMVRYSHSSRSWDKDEFGRPT
jgi:hypothetical protein